MIFGTLIKVISGFYIGCVGMLTGISYHAYQVTLKCKAPNSKELHSTFTFIDSENMSKEIRVISKEEYATYLRSR